MDPIFVKLANFIIKINFGKRASDDPKLEILKKMAAEYIRKYFTNFIATSSAGKKDFEIIFDGNPEIETIKLKGSSKEYIRVVESRTDNKIVINFYLSTFQFDSLLKSVILSLLLKKGGIGMHASSIKTHNGAYLFLGPSGAGKSTAASLLARKYQVLSEDITILRKVKGKFFVFQMPFFEKVYWNEKGNSAYPVKKIFFLNKSKRTYAEKIPNKNDLTQKILDQVFNISDFPKNKMSEIFDLIENYDSFNLYFDKNEKEMVKIISGA